MPSRRDKGDAVRQDPSRLDSTAQAIGIDAVDRAVVGKVLAMNRSDPFAANKVAILGPHTVLPDGGKRLL